MTIHDLRFSDPAHHMLYLFLQTGSAIWKTLEEKVSEDHVTLAQLRLLFVISRHNRPLTSAEVGRYVFRESHTTAVTLKRLEKGGYIEKTRDEKDRRMGRIEITEKGRQLIEKHHLWITSAVNEMLSCFSEGELQQFEEYLKRLRQGVFGLFGTEIVEPMDGFMDAL